MASKSKIALLASLGVVAALVGVTAYVTSGGEALPVAAGFGPNPTLPEPQPSMFPTMKIAPAKGWAEGEMPTAAEGLSVTAFASGLDHPRWLYELPNGDVLVAESNGPEKKKDSVRAHVQGIVMGWAGATTPSANRISLLRDADGDGVAETRTRFLEGLTSPFGMALVGDTFYVANTDAVVAFPYVEGETAISAPPTKVVDLPGGPINHHWTKNIIASPDGSKLYATVGSNSNVGENGMEAEEKRAAILEIDLASKNTRVFASGLRNPNGMDFEPVTGALWTAVNERDEIGNDLVPDYMTSVQDGGFYGWPYSYFGQIVDERAQPPRPDLVAKAIKPDYALGAHTASLGLTFYKGSALPQKYFGGAFIGQHGSWNRRPANGYKVVFVPFADGKPAGQPQDVLTGFLDVGSARGRPVGVIVERKGSLLVADDVGNVIWRVSPAETSAASRTALPQKG